MQFKLYLLDVSELEDSILREKVLSLMDSFRKGKLSKYKTEKDRLHQIATGLLLQIGLLELEINNCRKKDSESKDGREIYLCTISEAIHALEMYSIENNFKVPVNIRYDIAGYGKPRWNPDFLKELPVKKRFEYFSISHSGQYAGVVIADCEVGLDIQQSRVTKYIEGGYMEFSRLESYVKCTGEGYAKGAGRYQEFKGEVPGYSFYKIEAIEKYAIYLCSGIQ